MSFNGTPIKSCGLVCSIVTERVRKPPGPYRLRSAIHDNFMSKQFVNDVASIAILATCWHEVPMPPLEGEVPNEREAEGFVRKLSKKTPQSARSGCQLPFQGSQGGFAARVARLATPTSLILLTMRSYIFNSCNRRERH